MSDTAPPPPPAPLAVDAAEAARLLGVSVSHWHAMMAAGRCPTGFRLGRRRLWSTAELKAWLDAGAPPADRWMAAKKQ